MARRVAGPTRGGASKPNEARSYAHPEAESLLRPDVGTQAQFRKKKPPKTYRYDSSLSPALDWDGQNPARVLGEWLVARIEEAVTMETDHRGGHDVPAWLLDTDYNGLCFHVCQAFFPRTAAWDDLKRSLRGEFEDAVWEHLAGTVSAPFEAGEHRQVAVKVIDDRGNELLVVKPLPKAGR